MAKKQKKSHRAMHTLGKIAFGVLILFFISGGLFFVWVATLEIPEGNIDDRIVAQSTKIYDSSGEVLLYDVFGEQRRTVVPLEEISLEMRLAIIATEDDSFYEHSGVRPLAVLRAVYYKLRNPESRLQGGSTITQQVIKNALLTNDRKIERKVKEWVLAWRLENKKSKDEILEIYLNEIPFGGPVYGVEQAARSFYGKKASELSVAESAYLAALPKAPTTYLNNREKLVGRANYIMRRMYDLGFISSQAYEEARGEEVNFIEQVDKGIKAPHFVFYTLERLQEEVDSEVKDFTRGGYKIYTTLNWELQQEVEEVVERQAKRVAENYRASNVAVVVLENKTGKIRAMVGSKDYFAEDIDGKFNITTALRQPGSTFKPFVYAAAFTKGYLPQTVLWDAPTEFSQACFPDGEPKSGSNARDCYAPQNYDKRFRGPVDLRSALAQSLNLPAVKLLYLVGVSDAMNFAKSLGISSLNKSPSFYGLNLVLGGGEVRMIDMAQAYSTFGNDGTRLETASWEELQSKTGEILSEYEAKKSQVIDTQTARMINDILSDNAAKMPMFGVNSSLYYNNYDVAVKTGTTNNYQDVWTAGYSSDVTVVVWAGNNDNTPLAQSPSSSVVGPFWREVMDVALQHYSNKPFVAPNPVNLEEYKPILRGDYQSTALEYLDPDTGEVIENPDPNDLDSYSMRRKYHSILHYVKRQDVRGEMPTSDERDGLYKYFEYGVQKWTTENGWSEAIISPPGGGGGDHSGDNSSDDQEPAEPDFNFSIKKPEAGKRFDVNETIKVELATLGNTRKIDRIYYYLNNTYLGSGGSRITEYSFRLSDARRTQEINTLKVIVETDKGERITQTREIIAR
ncbi:MAG: transglycosylase domain-containing protein [Patescibacteria group bacterium]